MNNNLERNIVRAQVSAVHRDLFKVICEYGERDANLKSSIYFNEVQLETFPTVGDFVEIEYNDNGPSRIIKTLERKTYFSRKDPDPNRGEQAVAANFDYVCIVTSMNHDFNLRRMERYLTVAWESGAQPIIVLTKADLTEHMEDYVSQLEYTAIGVQIIPVSSKTGYGLDELRPYVGEGKTVVFMGSSGVGKSTLINALAGCEIMDTGEIREDDSRGRHTTTHRQLIELPTGARVIDTPGMRELGMWDVSEGLSEAFGDIEELVCGCKFSDCTHKNEPGCKINEALIEGTLSPERWKRYLTLKKESQYAQKKQALLKSIAERKNNTHKVYTRKKKVNYDE